MLLHSTNPSCYSSQGQTLEKRQLRGRGSEQSNWVEYDGIIHGVKSNMVYQVIMERTHHNSTFFTCDVMSMMVQCKLLWNTARTVHTFFSQTKDNKKLDDNMRIENMITIKTRRWWWWKNVSQESSAKLECLRSAKVENGYIFFWWRRRRIKMQWSWWRRQWNGHV